MPQKTSLKRFQNWAKPEVKHGIPTKWGWVVFYPDKLVMGKDTDIGYGTAIYAQHGVFIGDNVQIGGGCRIYSKSTIDNKEGLVKLKDNCKIGANSVIMPGVTIGENSVVGALSFVNKNIPPNVKVGGIPVKILL